jgi:hypothetical protein
MPFPRTFYTYLREHTLAGIKGGRDRTTFLDIRMVSGEGRVFARSWNKSEKSWFTAFRDAGEGPVRYGDTVMQVSGKILDAASPLQALILAACLEKYTQPENIPYAQGITQPAYEAYTREFLMGREAVG